MSFERSKVLFEEARKYIPGGVNSPVRAFGSVGGTPLFIRSGRGALLSDEDGNEYIDFVASWGPLILGHAYPRVIDGPGRRSWPAAPRSARRWNWSCGWPSSSASWCRAWRGSGWSTPAPRPP